MSLQKNCHREHIIEAWTTVGRSLGILIASFVVPDAPTVSSVFPEQQVLNVKQAAKYIGYGATKFKELRNTGLIRATELGSQSRPRFLKADLDRYLATLRRKEN